MFIKNLKLKNFRNYDNLDINFENGVNILYGDNAQGKTNILEALYISSTSKSHKQVKDKELIKFNEEEAHIKVILNKNNIDKIIDIHIKKNTNKGIAINGLKIDKITNFIGNSNIIFFAPEDLNIIKEGPSKRRKFIDIFICNIDKIYSINLSKYNKILNQRNNLLKTIKQTQKKQLIETLDSWDIELVKYGREIIKKRNEIINILNQKIYEKHYFISGNKEEIKTYYENNINEEEFLTQLKNKKEEDLKYSNTQIGPHRDDIKFEINNIDIRKYGSQGQQRTAALSIKLAELEMIKNIKQDNPILLLDDVFSELDEERKTYLVENIKNIQTIITTTGIDKELLKQLNPKTLYKIKKGKIA